MSRIIAIIFFIAFSSISVNSYAQPDPPPDPDAVPITGVEWLLLTGGIFGARKIYQNLKKDK